MRRAAWADRRNKVGLCLCLVILLLCLGSCDTAQQSDKVQKVFSVQSDDGVVAERGTAFYISETTLVTAAHVLGYKHVVIRDGEYNHECSVLAKDDKFDVAILQSTRRSPEWYTLKDLGLLSTVSFPAGKGPVRRTGPVEEVRVTFSFPSGSSGSPLLWNGFVVGMGVAHDSADTCGMFVPVWMIEQVLVKVGKN